MCEDKPVVKTRYVEQEECEDVTREDCGPVTREQCSQVVDRVPHQSTQEVCRFINCEFVLHSLSFSGL